MSDVIVVDSFTDGLLDPGAPMLGPVPDGARVEIHTAPGCLGPMITPALRGGHEVSQPVAVAGARPGDALVLRILDIRIASAATASGCSAVRDGHDGDPVCAAVCPGCGLEWPATRVNGIGPEAVRCEACGADAAPFAISHGYTMVLDRERAIGLTVPGAQARAIAADAHRHAALPPTSRQHSVLTLAPHDIPAVATRLRPFLGQLGTTPSMPIPDSHNAGDFGQALIGAGHRYALSPAELDLHRTDGHMDIDAVRDGAIVVCPVKVPGGGVYAGDMHAMQGDGEIAGHTTDVTGVVELQVSVLPGVGLEGPVLFPRAEDLPYLARPLTDPERDHAEALARAQGFDGVEADLPISVVGTGPDLNSATDNGIARSAALLGIPALEVRNRATIAGAIEIGRHPGVVQITFRAPETALAAAGLLALAREQCGP
jgi:formamidase